MRRIAARSLSRRSLVLIAVFAFLALYLVGVPFPLVVIGAGLVGLLARDLVTPQSDPAGALEHPERVRPTIARTVRVLALGLTVWLLPLLAVAAAAGFDSVLAEEALFAVDPRARDLSAPTRRSPTRPGRDPVQLVDRGRDGGGAQPRGDHPGTADPRGLFRRVPGRLPGPRRPHAGRGGCPRRGGGRVGDVRPSFLWIFLGAPSVERLRGNERLGSALAAITAAVVGVIGNLAVTFATKTSCSTRSSPAPPGRRPVPIWSSVDPSRSGVAVAAFVAIRRFDVNVVWVVLVAGAIGMVAAIS